MSAFIGKNAYLWQKIAVNVTSNTSLEALQDALRGGATFFLVRLGLHTTRECEVLIDRCNEAILNYVNECVPWTVSVGVICELSGPQPRVKFGGDKNIAKATEGQIITFTHDARYENQYFDEVKYVTNFNQLNVVTVGDVLSIGQVLLTAERIVPGHLTCRTIQGGTFASCSSVELLNRTPSNPWKDEPESLCSAPILNECKRILEKGCRFVVLPNMKNSASYRATLEAIRLKELDSEFVHLIANCDDKHELINRNETAASFDTFLTNDVETLLKAKAEKYAVILHLTTDQIPQFTEKADTIAVDICNLTILQNYLKQVNQERLRCDGVVKNCSIGPEDTSLVKCVQYASREAESSAVILCYSKNVSLPRELATQDILRIVFVIVRTSEEAAQLLLRKNLLPIVVPPWISSHELMIRHAIAFGKRFGFLHVGNCVVSGFTAASPGAGFGMELRYVPPMDAGY